jgi:glycosyltransferase involved in cell wall biosynthesis
VILTPTFDGRDGLSCLSREFACGIERAVPQAPVTVVSLAGEGGGAPHLVACGGSRLRFVRQSVKAAWRRPAVVVAMHANMLPATVPFLAAGSRLLAVLVGIESWRELRTPNASTLRRAGAVVAISSHTARRFASANPGLAMVIDICRPSTPPLAAPVGPSPFEPGYALIVGRLSAEERYKGHDELIDIWPRVMEAVPGARLVVAGTGDDLPRLRDRARTSGLDGAIAFLGSVDDGTLAALYRDAGLLVMPSPNEGFGYVFLEAMASGCPCVGATGSAEEIIAPNETGLIVDPSDRAGLVRAVVRLMSDPLTARRMGEAGAARARGEFSSERFASDLGRVIGRLLAC